MIWLIYSTIQYVQQAIFVCRAVFKNEDLENYIPNVYSILLKCMDWLFLSRYTTPLSPSLSFFLAVEFDLVIGHFSGKGTVVTRIIFFLSLILLTFVNAT